MKNKKNHNKILNALTYFPIVNEINLIKLEAKSKKRILFKRQEKERIWRGRGSLVYGVLFLAYLASGIQDGTWTLKQMKEYERRSRIEKAEATQYNKEISTSYDSLNITEQFENAKTYEDSLNLIRKYYMPFKLLSPEFKDKEGIVQRSILEKKLE